MIFNVDGCFVNSRSVNQDIGDGNVLVVEHLCREERASLVNLYGCSIGYETRIGTSEIAQDQSVMLPLYHQITEEDQSYVAKVLWEASQEV